MELRRQFRVSRNLLGRASALALAACFGVSTLSASVPAQAAQTVPYKINFQGRLSDNSGNALSDGSYNVKFRLWTLASGGTNQWEGDRIMGASDNRVQLTNGLFDVQFGDTTKGDPAISPSLFNTGTGTLYLEVELPTPATATCAVNACAVFTEGAMTPRQPLASAAYAINSQTLNGLDATAFGQLTAIQTWTATNTYSMSGGAAIVLSGTAAASGSILQIGAVLSSGNASGTLLGANTTSAGDLINLQVSNALRLKVDNSGNLTTNGDITYAQGANHLLSVAQASAGVAGYNLTVQAGQSGTGVVNGGNLNLTAGATGGTGTPGSVNINSSGTPVFTVGPSGQVTVAPLTGQNLAINLTASSGVRVSSSTAPTVDQVNIDNTASGGVATAGVNALSVNYKGSTAAIAAGIESAAMRIDFAPSAVNPTSGTNTWSGLRIVANATGPTSNNIAYGIKLEGPTSPGAGQENAIEVATGWDIGLDIQSGGMQLADMSADPATPTSGNLRVYSRLVAGRSMLSAKGSSGISYALQASLAQQSVFLVTPGSGTTTSSYSAVGDALLAAGTLSTTTGVPSEAQGYMANVASAAVAGSAAGVSNAINRYFRGSVANGADGFFYAFRFSLPDTLTNYTSNTTGSRLFFGLTDQTLATMVASDTPTGNYVGISFSGVRDNASGQFQILSRDGTTATNTATGVTLAVGKTYNIYLYSKPRDTTVFWRIDNLTDGTTPVEGSKTTNLPTNTVALRSMFDFAPLTAVAHNLRFQNLYVETDR